MAQPLEYADTVLADVFRHRLALGIQLVDAFRQGGAFGPLCVDVEKIGKRAFPRVIGSERRPMRFASHRSDRHSMRFDGRVRNLVEAVLRDLTSDPNAETGWVVRAYGPPAPEREHYDADEDVRRYVPRRLRFEIKVKDGAPEPTVANTRAPWLWPGSSYVTDETATIVRGRALRGPDLQHAQPVRWARAFLTTQSAGAAFDPNKIVGVGHGDDRGEFAIALSRTAQTAGVALTRNVDVRLWVFAPPALALVPGDGLSDLPVEDAAALLTGSALRADRPPPGYTEFGATDVSIPLGSVMSGPATTLLKP